jgi:hypothetical protein
MNTNDVLKTYAIFYVSENDEFDVAKKLDMLKFIEEADDSMIMDLFENNEIEAPLDLFTEIEEKDEMEIAKIYEINLDGLDISSLNYNDVMMESSQILEYGALDQAKDGLKNALGMKMSLRGQLHVAGREAKAAIRNKMAALDSKISDFRDAISKGAGKAVKAGGEALEKGKEVAGEAGEAIAKGAKSAGKAVKAVTDDAGKAIEGGVKTAHKAVGAVADTAKDVATQAGQKVATGVGKAAEFAQGQPGMVGAAVAAAAAMTAGVMAYRRFFSKAAKACGSAPDKKACMAQYKMKAKQAQMATLNAGKAKCAKSKNAAGCKAKIDNKINALKSQMRG